MPPPRIPGSKVQKLVPIASIQGLTVRYGRFEALKGVTFDLPEGCIGLLGPNGAGKSTLLKTFLGFVKPTSGGGSVLGFDIGRQGMEIRQVVGYMPEQDCHIPGMSAVEFVSYAGELSGMPRAQAIRRAHEVIEYCGLGEARYRQMETYSTGMKQRIKLAQALVHGPKLLLLDEPTNGLDPRGREDMLELVRSVSHGKGISVVVSSHLLKDIERTCDHVVVVTRGTLTAQGPIKDLKLIQGEPLDLEVKEMNPAFAPALIESGLTVVGIIGMKARVTGPGTRAQNSTAVFAAAARAGIQIRAIAPAERSLEEAFLEVVGNA